MRPDTPETAFEDALLALAFHQGWLCHCERPAYSSDTESITTAIKGRRGYPDVTAVHPFKGVVFAELKSATGRLAVDQRGWITELARYDTPDSDVLVEVWRPADWPAIEVCLTEGVQAYRARFRSPSDGSAPDPTLTP